MKPLLGLEALADNYSQPRGAAGDFDGDGQKDVFLFPQNIWEFEDIKALSVAPQIIFNAFGGASNSANTVLSASDFVLGADDHNLTLIGRSDAMATGNARNNVITGNAGPNMIDGGRGSDTLVGGAGNDTYIIDRGDVVREVSGGGIDTVRSTADFTLPSHVENGVLLGTSAARATGNNLNNTLVGNSAANILRGAGGSDTLTGGQGADLFVYRSSQDSGANISASDVITDFDPRQDKIDLKAIDAFAGSTSNLAFVWRGSGAFVDAAKGEIRFQKFDNPGSSRDYTMVFVDTDSDAQVEMAIRLDGLLDLTAQNFIL